MYESLVDSYAADKDEDHLRAIFDNTANETRAIVIKIREELAKLIAELTSGAKMKPANLKKVDALLMNINANLKE